MKHLVKSISCLNNYNFNTKENHLKKGFKFPNATINIKQNKKFLISLNLNQKKLCYTNRKNNSEETLNINLLKSPINNILSLRKSRNKLRRSLLNQLSNIDLFEKLKSDNIKKETVKNRGNYLLLTSLYNLPKIKKPANLNKKLYFNSHFGDSTKNEFYIGQNDSVLSEKNIFNQSLTSSNDKSSSDTEKKLKDKINIKSFPSDHSLKDKIIHLKKFGVFWDSVFNYCVPIISVKKYKAQRDLSERKKLDYLKLIESKSNYYELMTRQNITHFSKSN